DEGGALRAAVFDPLGPALAGRARLLLAPDGDLTRLPFETLPVGGRRLLDDYRISYLGCGRDVLRFGAVPAGQPTGAVVLADPDFDLGAAAPAPATPPGRRSRDLRAGAIHFPRLPGTRAEG